MDNELETYLKAMELRMVYRLAEWSEDTDTELLRHASRITELERQIAELKQGRARITRTRTSPANPADKPEFNNKKENS